MDAADVTCQDSSWFTEYGPARLAFREAADRAGWRRLAWATGHLTPQGEALTIDVADSHDSRWTGPVLLVSSGLHGVEGPFGSAVQRAWLGDAARPSGVRVLLLHVLNPYGFAWARRVDAGNVDLNRAFRRSPPSASGNALDDNPGADLDPTLDRLLNPPWAPVRVDAFTVRLLATAVRRGPRTLRRAIASGQRSHPKGLFYAGPTITVQQRLLESELPGLLAHAETVLHVDLHTGLGRWGTHALIVDYPIGVDDRRWLERILSPSPVVEPAGSGDGYVASGSLGQWAVAQRFAPRYRFVFAEFGTYGSVAVLAGLRAENQSHHWGTADRRRAQATASRLVELFGPADVGWRRRVMSDARALLLRATTALQHGQMTR